MKKMKIIDFLRMFDGCLPVIVYVNEEEDPLWEGRLFNTPWWVADLELNYDNENGSNPVDYRESFGKEYNNNPGLVIFAQDRR